MQPRARCVAIVLALVLTACGGEESSSHDDGGLDRRDGAPGPGPTCGSETLFAGTPTLALEIGRTEGSIFTAWSDGTEVPFVWGPQGGTMVVPTFRVDAALGGDGDSTCLLVEIENREPGGGTVFDGFRTSQTPIFASREGDRWVLRDVFDPLGWAEIPRGTVLELDVVVRGRVAAAHATVRLTIVPPPPPLIPPECEGLPVTGEGCRYREIPTFARIARVALASPDDPGERCPAEIDPMIVEAEIAVAPDFAACTTREARTERLLVSGYLPSIACAQRVGLVEGASFPVERREIVSGKCTPFFEDIPALAPCLAACLGE